MPTRGDYRTKIDWASAYIASVSSGFGTNNITGALPLPTLPVSVSESIAANTNEQAIVARSAPIISYVNTGARVVSFTIPLADDYMPLNEKGERYTLHTYIDALKSLEYPAYNKNEVVAPQVVVQVANIKLKGICTSVSINWNGPLSDAVYKGSSTGTYTRADVALQFKEVSNVVKGSIDIKGGNY